MTTPRPKRLPVRARAQAHHLLLEDAESAPARQTAPSSRPPWRSRPGGRRPFELRMHGPPALGARRRPRRRAARSTAWRERARVGGTGDARDTLRDVHGGSGLKAGEARLHPAVLEERARLQPGDILAAGLDQELDRLEDPRADRSVGDREDVETARPVGRTGRRPAPSAARRTVADRRGVPLDQFLL